MLAIQHLVDMKGRYWPETDMRKTLQTQVFSARRYLPLTYSVLDPFMVNVPENASTQ